MFKFLPVTELAHELQMPLAFVRGCVVAVFLLLYIAAIVPGTIARVRCHPSTMAITFLGLFGGFTVVGWIVALVWSMRPFPESQRRQRKPFVDAFIYSYATVLGVLAAVLLCFQ